MLRPVPTWLLIVLTLVTGLAIGVVIGRHWRATALRVEWHQAQRRATDAWRRRIRPDEWRQDSTRRAAAESTFARRRTPVLPREIARQQLFADCALGFEVRDSVERLALFEARARVWQEPSHNVTKASAFRPTGFTAGDTVWIVVHDMNCGELAIGGFALLPVRPETLRARIR